MKYCITVYFALACKMSLPSKTSLLSLALTHVLFLLRLRCLLFKPRLKHDMKNSNVILPSKTVKEGNVVGFSYGKEKLPLDVGFSRCCERHMIKKMTRLFPCWQVTWSANRLLKNSYESRTSLNIDVIFFTRIRQRLTSLIQSIIIHSDIHCSLGVGFGEDW